MLSRCGGPCQRKLSDMLVLSEMVHDIEQVLIQDGTLLQIDTWETVGLSGCT